MSSWDEYPLVGRGFSRREGVYTSSSGGIPPGELDCVPARREGFLPTRWDEYPLVGRGFSRREADNSGQYSSTASGGVASLGTGYPLGYPDIRQVWAEKQPSAAETAPAGGYPLALAGIRQRIADIRGGLSATISKKL
ncbi:hypothetical protein PGT21_008370 [Puccinia graminis f. sp. tritici]|uniref:Uncharacterized protein n=1 Tax=Puccinia graminis f. sp. tritici TaxID=56615 RepID=A0A5B0NIA4_PUCGR|nr:hypothetical protein PGTUg99_030220 [Puccinia graminis f. sp. tritici]KAA1105468.1 hypothetical protein PGT21_008370 [Puccinia graminis f. sp. tritici]